MPMSKEGVKDKMKDHNVVVLNVLPEAEYAKSHITGSRNIPLGESAEEFAKLVEQEIGKNNFIITYCAGPSCDAGPKAAKILSEKGFKTSEFAGGMKEWSEAGYPTEGTEVKMVVATK